MNPLSSKPFYNLEIKLKGSSIGIEVNGNVIFKDLSHNVNITTKLPINQWMRSGTNEIKIIILPRTPGELIEEFVDHNIKLTVHNDELTNANKYEITTINYNGKNARFGKPYIYSADSGKLNSSNNFIRDKNGDVEIFDIIESNLSSYQGALVIKRLVDIPSTLPEWKFFSSEELADFHSMNDDEYYRVIEELLIEYQKVFNAIKSGEIKSVLPMFKERNYEYDSAYHVKPGTFESRVTRALNQMSNRVNVELVPLKKDFLNIEVFSNNKLARLVQADGKSAIAQNFIKGKGAVRFDLIFRRQNGKWVLTR